MKSPALPPGFLRVAAAAPALRVADPAFNASAIEAAMREAATRGAAIVLFPELSLTGYTCGDLFAQELLLEAAQNALLGLAAATKSLGVHAVVGLPCSVHDRLYNCAAVLGNGQVL